MQQLGRLHTHTHMDSRVTTASACSSVEDRYASLREAASTHSVLSVGVSCFQRSAAEMEVVRDNEGRTTWSVSTFSILLLSQVTMLSLFLLVCIEAWCNITHMYIAPSLRRGGMGEWGRVCICSFNCLIS